MAYGGSAKTRLLTPTEVQHLREQIAARFSERHPDRRPVEAKTYLGAYDELHDDMRRLLPDAIATSVSLHRLRKLFYYTDPAVCPPKQRETSSFGRDFLAALEQYIAEEEPVPPPVFTARSVDEVSNKPVRWSIPAVLLLLIVVVVMVVSRPPPGQERVWREDFTEVSVAALEKHGWEVIDLDTAWWNCQDEPGMLTLHTLPGDYWVKPGEPRIIPNLLLRPLPDGPASVTVKIAGFHPAEIHQQIGFIFLNANRDRMQHLRSTIGFGLMYESRTQLPGNQVIAFVDMINIHVDHTEEVFNVISPIYRIRPNDDYQAVDTAFLRVELRDQKVRVWRKLSHEWAAFYAPIEMDLSFQPTYFAVAAFQGWTDDNGRLKGSQIIPAYIDWVEVRRLED